ncbi:hypothetical protein ABHN09_02085 [Bacillus paramobilis]|uniref:hypothetical protein n=1 Tax=Bacillus paramobilis TaxID=2817477 RepID=UPI003D19B3B7
MKTTHHFNDLPGEIKTLLTNSMDLFELEINPAFRKLSSQGNRGIVFEIVGSDLVIKWIQGKNGAKDSDIKALLDLDGVVYFPKLYAYEERSFLVMEKVKGQDIAQLVRENLITDAELRMVKLHYKDAVSIGIQKKRYDWDIKLEHLYWDQKANKLKIIDLGFWDEFNLPSNSTTNSINQSIETFDRELAYMGRRI